MQIWIFMCLGNSTPPPVVIFLTKNCLYTLLWSERRWMNGSSHLPLFTTTIFYFSHLAECGFFSVGTFGSSCFRVKGVIFFRKHEEQEAKILPQKTFIVFMNTFQIMRFLLTWKFSNATQNLKKCLVPSNMTITSCFFMPNRDCFSGLLPSCMPPFEEKDFLVRMQQHESSEQAREEMEKRTANWHKKREGSRKEKWSRHDFIC